MTGQSRQGIADRIAVLEARNPGVMIWPPDGSVSGQWEALGDGWLIQETSPARFAELLAAMCAPSLTARELAALLGVSCDTVYRLIRAGEVRADREGKSWRISGASARAYLRASRPGALVGHDLLTLPEAAEAAGVSRWVVWSWVKAGTVHPVPWGKFRRYRRGELEAVARDVAGQASAAGTREDA